MTKKKHELYRRKAHEKYRYTYTLFSDCLYNDDDHHHDDGGFALWFIRCFYLFLFCFCCCCSAGWRTGDSVAIASNSNINTAIQCRSNDGQFFSINFQIFNSIEISAQKTSDSYDHLNLVLLAFFLVFLYLYATPLYQNMYIHYGMTVSEKKLTPAIEQAYHNRMLTNNI